MKNLYIYTFNGEKISRTVWEDLSQTRDGKLVTKKNKDHRLKYGNYRNIKDLMRYIKRTNHMNGKTTHIEYFSFEDDVDINLLVRDFIDNRNEEIAKLQNEIQMIENAKADYLNSLGQEVIKASS